MFLKRELIVTSIVNKKGNLKAFSAQHQLLDEIFLSLFVFFVVCFFPLSQNIGHTMSFIVASVLQLGIFKACNI